MSTNNSINQNIPLVSVIIPCYNAEEYVEEAVRSIMNQTYKNLEIIVIDDCSTDSTFYILKNLSKEDSRIKLFRNETNLKLVKTLNNAIAICQGEYIARMDADDISTSDRIEKQLHFMLNNPQIDIIGSNYKQINKLGNLLPYISNFPLTNKKIIKQLTWKCNLAHPTIFAKKTFFTDLNGFDETLQYAEDYELWIRGAYYHNKIFGNLPDVLLFYRIHDTQMTSNSFNIIHAKIIRKFLYQNFLQTKNFRFLFGVLVQTKLFYLLIRYSSQFRNHLRKCY